MIAPPVVARAPTLRRGASLGASGLGHKLWRTRLKSRTFRSWPARQPGRPRGWGLSALDDVVNLEDVRRAGELDAGGGEDRHQTLAESLELLPRIPDLADLKVAGQTEADMVVQPGWWPLARVREQASRLGVFSAVRAMGLKRATMLMM